jgi:hypothetical protein
VLLWLLFDVVVVSHEEALDAWWNCRLFVLNDDLSFDYDIGGLAVSLTFLMNVFAFVILIVQVFKKEGGGMAALLEPPGSYCAYAVMYITCALIKTFTLATHTYEEQQKHIQELQSLAQALLVIVRQAGVSCSDDLEVSAERDCLQCTSSEKDIDPVKDREDTESFFSDDGPIFIDDSPKPARGMTRTYSLSRSTQFQQSPSAQISVSQPLQLPAQQLLLPSKNPVVASHPFFHSMFDSLIQGPSNADANNPLLIDNDELIPLLPTDNNGPANSPVSSTLKVVSTDCNEPLEINRGIDRDKKFVVPMTSQQMAIQHNRQHALAIEHFRQTITDLVSQIRYLVLFFLLVRLCLDFFSNRKYDPYPCILGIPIMPALFNTSKFYLFISFALIGSRTMLMAFHQLNAPP